MLDNLLFDSIMRVGRAMIRELCPDVINGSVMEVMDRVIASHLQFPAARGATHAGREIKSKQ